MIQMRLIQLGRMVLTHFLLMSNYDIFLSDTDVIYFRDPLTYVLKDADITVTSTTIPDYPLLKPWGGYFFADQPNIFYTLNNGVVYYRHTKATKIFMEHLVIKSLLREVEKHVEDAFLQITFNRIFQNASMLMHPVKYGCFHVLFMIVIVVYFIDI